MTAKIAPRDTELAPAIGLLGDFILRGLLANYGTIYLMLMGAIAIIVMLKAPFGIWGFVIRRYGSALFPVGRRLRLPPLEGGPEREGLR